MTPADPRAVRMHFLEVVRRGRRRFAREQRHHLAALRRAGRRDVDRRDGATDLGEHPRRIIPPRRGAGEVAE
jgi:hypothetical protein